MSPTTKSRPTTGNEPKIRPDILRILTSKAPALLAEWKRVDSRGFDLSSVSSLQATLVRTHTRTSVFLCIYRYFCFSCGEQRHVTVSITDDPWFKRGVRKQSHPPFRSFSSSSTVAPAEPAIESSLQHLSAGFFDNNWPVSQPV